MSKTSETPQQNQSETKPEKEPGIIARFMQKLDEWMKRKAEKAADKGSCCGGDSKGGKCC
jgi:hypothetical protein